VPQDIWDWLAGGILLIGYGGALAVICSGLAHLRAWHLLPFQLLVPAYWILHSIATLYAVRELITAPTSWSKTAHGLTRVARTGAVSAEALRPRSG
jgi:hypothetical protein